MHCTAVFRGPRRSEACSVSPPSLLGLSSNWALREPTLQSLARVRLVRRCLRAGCTQGNSLSYYRTYTDCSIGVIVSSEHPPPPLKRMGRCRNSQGSTGPPHILRICQYTIDKAYEDIWNAVENKFKKNENKIKQIKKPHHNYTTSVKLEEPRD